jgi:hypothetical protein
MNDSLRRFFVPVLGPIQYGLAGIGRKPGAEYVASMLLSDIDLPGTDLKITYDYTFRTHSLFNSSEEIRRARRIGSISASRVLRNEEVGRSLATLITRYASSEDAFSQVGRSSEYVLTQPLKRVVSNEPVSNINVPGFERLIVRELRGSALKQPVGDRLLFGNVEEIFVRMMFGADGEIERLWAWDDIISIATEQAERVRTVLSEAET